MAFSLLGTLQTSEINANPHPQMRHWGRSPVRFFLNDLACNGYSNCIDNYNLYYYYPHLHIVSRYLVNGC